MHESPGTIESSIEAHGYKAPPATVQKQRLNEQRLIHLLLKNPKNVELALSLGVTAGHFDPQHQPIISTLLDQHKMGCGLDRDSYRMRLQKTYKHHGRKFDLPGSMDIFTACELPKEKTTEDMLPVLCVEVIEGHATVMVGMLLDSLQADIKTLGWQGALERLSESSKQATGEIQEAAAGDFFEWTDIDQIEGETEPDWIWEKYIAKGHISLLTAQWKAGKTTLLAHMLKQMADGSDLMGNINQTKVCICSEEPQTMWKKRRQEIGIQGDIQVFRHKGIDSQEEWELFVQKMIVKAKDENIGLLIIDSMINFLPTNDENNPVEMKRVMFPLRKLTDMGMAVLVAHHPKKGDSIRGQSSRGSGSIPAFADICFYLKRGETDTQRKVELESRYHMEDETLDLTDKGYVRLSACDLACDLKLVRREEVLRILKVAPATKAEIKAQWSAGKITVDVLDKLLKSMKYLHLIEVLGEEVNGKANTYKLPDTTVEI